MPREKLTMPNAMHYLRKVSDDLLITRAFIGCPWRIGRATIDRSRRRVAMGDAALAHYAGMLVIQEQQNASPPLPKFRRLAK